MKQNDIDEMYKTDWATILFPIVAYLAVLLACLAHKIA